MGISQRLGASHRIGGRALAPCQLFDSLEIRAPDQMGEPTMRGVAIVLWTSMSLLLGLVSAQAEKRVALVVGNDRYANLSADRQLQRAVNDARAVGETLGRIGFEVIRG